MADGIIFYWVSWILWIIVTFLMNKGMKRTFLASLILLSIGFSNIYLTINMYEVSLLLLLFFIGSLLIYTPLLKKTYYLYRPFIIMIGFTAILLFDRGVPISAFLPGKLLIPLICSLLIMILTRDIYSQLINGMLGIVSGEFVHSMILSSYGLQNTIGNKIFLDYILFTIFLIICFNKLLSLIVVYKQQLKTSNGN